MRPKESRILHHVGELVGSTMSDWISRPSSLGSRIFGEAKIIGVIFECGLEGETAIDGMILIEVDSKKTGPDPVSLVAGMRRNLSYHVPRTYCSTTQCL